MAETNDGIMDAYKQLQLKTTYYLYPRLAALQAEVALINAILTERTGP